jgi:DTW domain-containing protein YfiP
MSTRRSTRDKRCTVCRIHHLYCVCSQLKPFSIKTQVSIIVHVRELHLTSHTPHFLKLMLPGQLQTFLRGELNHPFASSTVLQRPGQAMFLYPHEGAHDLSKGLPPQINPDDPFHLVVPDGSWTQARKVFRREPAMNSLPLVTLPETLVGNYQLRKAPRENWLSTYEAVAYALGYLEGEKVRDQLLEFFHHWVKTVVTTRTEFVGEE